MQLGFSAQHLTGFRTQSGVEQSRVQVFPFPPAKGPQSTHKAKYIILQIYSINFRKLPLTALLLLLAWSGLLCFCSGLLGEHCRATALSLFALKLILRVLARFSFSQYTIRNWQLAFTFQIIVPKL